MPVVGTPLFGQHTLFKLSVMMTRSTDPVAFPSWQEILDWSVAADAIDIGDQENDGDVAALARAIVGARTTNATLLTEARDLIIAGYPTFSVATNRTLAVGRNVTAIVCAWDIIRQANPGLLSGSQELIFRQWLLSIWNSPEMDDGRTFQEACFERPNNWGGHCRAAGSAICSYLEMTAELLRLANSFDAWSGNTASPEYVHFDWSDSMYQVPGQPLYGIVPAGLFWDSPTNTQPADGAQPEEIGRDTCYVDVNGDPVFHWRVPETVYLYEGLMGPVVQAAILAENGFPTVWTWNNDALKRAYNFNVNEPRECVGGVQNPSDTAGLLATGDDSMIGRVLNIKYGLSHTVASYRETKNCVGLDWYYGG